MPATREIPSVVSRSDPTPTPEQTPVTVVGLGSMGQALAGTLHAAGHPTTVWNRSAHRAEALAAEGATAAPTVADAVAASPLTIICACSTVPIRARSPGRDRPMRSAAPQWSTSPPARRATPAVWRDGSPSTEGSTSTAPSWLTRP